MIEKNSVCIYRHMARVLALGSLARMIHMFHQRHHYRSDIRYTEYILHHYILPHCKNRMDDHLNNHYEQNKLFQKKNYSLVNCNLLKESDFITSMN